MRWEEKKNKKLRFVHVYLCRHGEEGGQIKRRPPDAGAAILRVAQIVRDAKSCIYFFTDRVFASFPCIVYLLKTTNINLDTFVSRGRFNISCCSPFIFVNVLHPKIYCVSCYVTRSDLIREFNSRGNLHRMLFAVWLHNFFCRFVLLSFTWKYFVKWYTIRLQ